MRSGTTVSFCWLARASSLFISSELFELAVKTSNMSLDFRIARTMAIWKFSPGRMSRLEIQH